MGTPRRAAARPVGPIDRAGTAALLVLVVALLTGGCNRAPEGSALDPASLGPQPTPEQAMLAYVEILERGVADPDLPLYTGPTRQLLAGATVSRKQQLNELRPLRRALDSMTVRRRGDLAVVRFGSAHPKIPPYFLRRDPTGWRLDLATSSRVIVFDLKNEWRFRTREHEYAFAFEE